MGIFTGFVRWLAVTFRSPLACVLFCVPLLAIMLYQMARGSAYPGAVLLGSFLGLFLQYLLIRALGGPGDRLPHD